MSTRQIEVSQDEFSAVEDFLKQRRAAPLTASARHSLADLRAMEDEYLRRLEIALKRNPASPATQPTEQTQPAAMPAQLADEKFTLAELEQKYVEFNDEVKFAVSMARGQTGEARFAENTKLRSLGAKIQNYADRALATIDEKNPSADAPDRCTAISRICRIADRASTVAQSRL